MISLPETLQKKKKTEDSKEFHLRCDEDKSVDKFDELLHVAALSSTLKGAFRWVYSPFTTEWHFIQVNEVRLSVYRCKKYVIIN